MLLEPAFSGTPYDQRAQDEARHRDRLTRAIRLLRRLREAMEVGDPVPPLPEILAVTGLPHPGVEEPLAAVQRLLERAEGERAAMNRRLRLSRELSGAARLREQEPAPAPAPAPMAMPAPAPAPPPTATMVPSPWVDEVARLSRVSSRDLDGLPYGAILLDMSGRIVAYNDTESRMARLPVEAVLGRNFFTEVAPCTRVKDFEGRFRALAAGEGLPVVTFDFTFPFPFGAQRVSVMLTRGSAPGTVIMALLRR